MSVETRYEQKTDVEAIETIIVTAFLNAAHTSHTEQRIVNALRDAGQLSVSLVAEEDGTTVGHIAVSPVTISDGTTSWYGVGPVAVVPQHQGRGIGCRLVERALAELRALGANGCVVLGDPAFYHRFGFGSIPALVLPGVPAEYFQALRFRGATPDGTVSYHEAFNTSD